MTKKVTLFDTTLRDGEQGEGIAFTVEDKLKIALLLDAAGIDYIEGGWPGSNPKAIDFFKKMAKIKLKKAKMVAFGSTCRKGKPAKDDKNLRMLIEAKTPTVTIFGKCWDLHVKDALGISNEENIKLVKDSIKFLKSKKKEVIFDAEHFFDGFKSNSKYAVKVCQTAVDAGVDMISLCDTNGGSLPFEVEAIINELKKHTDIPLAIHAHNDADTAVANSLAAVNAGAVQVQGTINGYGERCGNANLCSVIPALQIKMKKNVVTKKQLSNLKSLSPHHESAKISEKQILSGHS